MYNTKNKIIATGSCEGTSRSSSQAATCCFKNFGAILLLSLLYSFIYRVAGIKGVLNPKFRPFSFELKKIRFFEINLDLCFRVL